MSPIRKPATIDRKSATVATAHHEQYGVRTGRLKCGERGTSHERPLNRDIGGGGGREQSGVVEDAAANRFGVIQGKGDRTP